MGSRSFKEPWACREEEAEAKEVEADHAGAARADMSGISWFPGHMHRARKEIAARMAGVQLVVELLDARTPFSSENPLVDQLRGKDTPCLKVLNKADLADPALTRRWIDYFCAQPGVHAIQLQATVPGDAQRIVREGEKLLAVAPHTSATIMVLGIPNVGKSTLINTLAGRAVCKTGDVPAVTQQQQQIVLTDRLMLLDTPGFLWPKLSPEECGHRLAITGAIKDVAFQYEDLVDCAAEAMVALYPERLLDLYGYGGPGKEQDDEPLGEQLLGYVARKRGCLLKGARPDLDKAAVAFIMDIRKGRLGRVTLETPEMVEGTGVVEAKAEGAIGGARRMERVEEKKRIRKLNRKRLKRGSKALKALAREIERDSW